MESNSTRDDTDPGRLLLANVVGEKGPWLRG